MASVPRDFIPCTSPREIGNGVFFRPIKAWHSGTPAGEHKLHDDNPDRSGCIIKIGDRNYTTPPLTVTHRIYWHERDKETTVSAFLSYPGGMSIVPEYFWETYGMSDDIERWIGDNAEVEMEMAIRVHFNTENK